MECKNCNGDNVVVGVRVISDNHKVGLSYGKIISWSEQVYSDVCDDCGEINRIYVKPREKRNWNTTNFEYAKIREVNRQKEELVKQDIEVYKNILKEKKYHKTFLDDISRFRKHDYHKHSISLNGPAYKLYVDKHSLEEVFIRPATMNLHKGKYVVLVIQNEKKHFDFGEDY